MTTSRRPRGLFDSVHRLGGGQTDVPLAANLLADKGVTFTSGDALDEVTAFGLAGGIGFLCGVFEYGDTPTMTIVGRNRSMPDPFVEQLLIASRAEVDIHTTGSSRAAATQLDRHLGRQTPCS